MPNHIKNKLLIIGSEADVNAVIENCKSIEDGKEVAMDFNKIIPMPESLDIESSSWLEEGMKYLLERCKPSFIADHDFIVKFEAYPEDRQQKSIELGRKGLSNIAQFNTPTWYEWSHKYWGTKWNAYNTNREGDTITFDTAWNGVPSLMVALSAKFPKVELIYSYADEDTGYNCGRIKITEGQIVTEDYPDGGSNEAYELAFELRPECSQYYEFVDGKYRYKEEGGE